MTPVESSSIDAIGYDGDRRELYVRFRASGRTYVYLDVDVSVYRELLNAESKGRFVNTRIKPHHRFAPC